MWNNVNHQIIDYKNSHTTNTIPWPNTRKATTSTKTIHPSSLIIPTLTSLRVLLNRSLEKYYKSDSFSKKQSNVSESLTICLDTYFRPNGSEPGNHILVMMHWQRVSYWIFRWESRVNKTFWKEETRHQNQWRFISKTR
jgi:hypothetical protein